MTTHQRSRILGIIVLVVLGVNAVLTTPALADGGIPATAPSTTTGSSTTAQSTPSGTSLVIMDNQGHKVPLGSQKALDIMNTGDPVWCPSSVTVPLNGSGGCSPAGASLAAVISWLNTHDPGVNGTIWIEAGYSVATGDPGVTSFSLDGSTSSLTNAAAHDLTIKGGWNGIGSSAITGTSTISGASLAITNWNGNIFLNNLIIGGAGTGLNVTTTKNIMLAHIQSNSNLMDGADLDNTSGTGSIVITQSAFNNNDLLAGYAGLDILSHGTVTLTAVQAGGNGIGVYVNNTGAPTALGVTINGASNFSNNGIGEGLDVYSHGTITITDLTASGNAGYGAQLDNCNLSGITCTTPTAPSITLSGTNIFDSNGMFGLAVNSRGTISANSLDANRNATYGTLINNSYATTAMAVTLTGTNSFTSNQNGVGLLVESQGAITANNVTANKNSQIGVQLYNQNNFISPIKLTGTNWFTYNGWTGLYVLSKGAISLNNITANSNGFANAYDGLYATNSSSGSAESIALTGNNTFNNNTNAGAELYATGAISANNVTAMNNFNSEGLLMDNSALGASKPQPVTLSGINYFYNNHLDNLDVSSYGNISLNDVTSNSSNAGDGANLSFNSIVAGSVTLNGFNIFDGNAGTYGLRIVANGSITLNNVDASQNYNGEGVFLDNTAGTSPVKINGTNTFNQNFMSGLTITSKGAVSGNNLTANLNGNGTAGNGVTIYNYFGSGQAVTLTGANVFNSNLGTGLSIQTNGSITTNNLVAIANKNGEGADLFAQYGTGNVTLNGFNTFNSNIGDGVYIVAKGNVIASNLTANSNGNLSGSNQIGVLINNSGGPGSVTITGKNTFFNNDQAGLDIISAGSVTTYNLNAISNGFGIANSSGDGVSISNTLAATPKNVSMYGLNNFSNNYADGASVFSHGAIAASNLTANENGNDGVYFINNLSGATGGISLTGSNVFLHNNGGDGLDLSSTGVINISHITAEFNYLNGLNVTTAANVYVTCGSFINNGTSGTSGYGVLAASTPLITLTGTDSAGNYSGAYFYPSSATFVRGCTLP